MKKSYSVKILGLVVILIYAFVFVGIEFVQGQVKIQKGKPPHTGKQKNTRSAVIFDGPGRGLKGAAGDPDQNDATWQGWVYDDSEPNVNIDRWAEVLT